MRSLTFFRACARLAAIAIALAATTATAAPLVYSGQLMAENGLPYTGNVDVSAALFMAADSPAAMWTSATTEEMVMGGTLDVRLEGDGLDAVLAANDTLWLEFTIDGETLSPRQEVSRVAYAAVAGNAQWLGGQPASAFLTTEDSLSGDALPTNGVGQISNQALNNEFFNVATTWDGDEVIGDFPDPGATADVVTVETDNSYFTALSITTSYELVISSEIRMVLYPPPVAEIAPITLEEGPKGLGIHTVTWTPANTPELSALLGKKVEGLWTVIVDDLDNNAAPGVTVGSLNVFSVNYDVVRSDHLQVAGRLDVETELNVGGDATIAGDLNVAGRIVTPGMTIGTAHYENSTIYAGSTSWQNGPVFQYEKTMDTSDLVFNGVFPYYITPGASGYGLRLQYSTDNSNWTDAGAPAGPGDGWGAGGYGGSDAGVTPLLEYISEIDTAGTVYFRMQYRAWSGSDTLTFINHGGYNKRAQWTVQEIAR